jgi:uncharacterized protein (TIGR04255 family)
MVKDDDWEQYPKPPITEAAVEFRLPSTLAQPKVEKAAKKLGKCYELSEEEHVSEFRIEAKTGKVQGGKPEWLGRKLSSKDRTDVLLLRKGSLIFSRLAPYQGWPDFRARIRRDWEAWVKATGASAISRIGMRYINRLDIPVGSEDVVNVDQYLNVGPRFPDISPLPMAGFSMQVRRPLAADQLDLILNTGTVVPPPVPGYASLTLDIDLSRSRDLPKDGPELWTLLDTMRSHKNRVFEACITPAARKLFS